MSSEQACRKRSEKARQQERDARGRFCSAGRSPPPPSAPEASASRDIPSTTERAPEASAGWKIRSASKRALRAIVRWEIRSASEHATEACAHREMSSGSGVVAEKKFAFCSSVHIILHRNDDGPCDDDSPYHVQQNKTTIKLLTTSEEYSNEESSSKEALVSPGKQKGKEKAMVTGKQKGMDKQMTFWVLHDEVASSQQNIEWLKAELQKETAKKKRLQAALIVASEKARNNQ